MTPTVVNVTIVLVSAAGIAFAFGTAGLFVLAFDPDAAVRDVQRFIELTEEARAGLARDFEPGISADAAATAVDRFLAKKEQARRALNRARVTAIRGSSS